jgi:hypothetical protein
MSEKDLDIDGMIRGKIPASNYRPSTLAFSLDNLYQEDREHRLKYYAGESFLFQYRIPPFQRAVVWTEEQCIKFIESAYRGYNLGTYTVNKLEWVGKGHDAHPHPYDAWLLDGLQRLTAIQKYYADAFKVFGFFWSELDKIDQCRFHNASLPCAHVSLKSLAELKEIYNALNFGGTPHTEEERA